jgi:tRNA G46 methylase TrmB
MDKHVCPWYLGYLLASPLRRLFLNPEKILSTYVKEGMAVLEVGPGMGFFTLRLAKLVGETGQIICVDVQEKMLKNLRKRVDNAGLLWKSKLAYVQIRRFKSMTLNQKLILFWHLQSCTKFRVRKNFSLKFSIHLKAEVYS